MAVACEVTDRDGLKFAALTGPLALADIAPLRLQLLTCLAEQPDAVLVDLSGLSVKEPRALSVFIAVSRQAARWPGIPIMLCAPKPPTRSLLNAAALRHLPLFATLDAARDEVGVYRTNVPSIRDELLPTIGAARQARDVATDACLRWSLPRLVTPASLIVDELVGNVVDHANTIATLWLSLHRRFLTIAVRDGSPAEPVLSRPGGHGAVGGRGLRLVEATAHNWGWMPTDDGKVVWASLAR
jgi:anti-anti-sigma regulatory factor